MSIRAEVRSFSSFLLFLMIDDERVRYLPPHKPWLKTPKCMISENSATLRGILIAFVAAELTQIISIHYTTKRYNSEESINLSDLLIATFLGSYNSKRTRNFLTSISQECLILTITPRYYTLICSSIPGKLSRIEVFFCKFFCYSCFP